MDETLIYDKLSKLILVVSLRWGKVLSQYDNLNIS